MWPCTLLGSLYSSGSPETLSGREFSGCPETSMFDSENRMSSFLFSWALLLLSPDYFPAIPHCSNVQVNCIATAVVGRWHFDSGGELELSTLGGTKDLRILHLLSYTTISLHFELQVPGSGEAMLWIYPWSEFPFIGRLISDRNHFLELSIAFIQSSNCSVPVVVNMFCMYVTSSNVYNVHFRQQA